MKRLMFPSCALALGALFLTGCTSLWRKPEPPRPRAFALAVTVFGSIQPTPAQWAAIQAAAAKELAANGCVLVSDLALADRIIRVDFIPDPADPENSGRATVLGYMPNPYRSLGNIAYHPVAAPRMSSTYYDRGYYDRGHYYDPSYPYSWYSDGYTYHAPTGSLVPVPPPATPPSPRANPRTREDVPSSRGSSTRFGGLPRTERPPPSDRSGPPPSSRSDSSYSSSSGSSSSGSSSGSYSSNDSSSYSSSSGGSSGGGSSYSAPSQSDRTESTGRNVQP